MIWKSLFPIISIVCVVNCSDGDRDPFFKECVKNCETKCKDSSQVLYWGCRGDCEYYCMFKVTEERIKLGFEVTQYFGKWPFYRMFGVIQEPASFVFSIMNFISQLIGWIHYRNAITPEYKFFTLAKTQFIINSLAWLCATVFHARDTYWTEKFDYFSAALVLAISMFSCFAHMAGTLKTKKISASGLLLTIVFSSHISYMAFIHFDYGYNMKFLLLNGVVNIILWLIWSWSNRTTRPVRACVFTMCLTFMLALLEILDFPPIFWIFDSHSLWHMSTIPIPYLWFRFLTKNALVDQIKLQRD